MDPRITAEEAKLETLRAAAAKAADLEATARQALIGMKVDGAPEASQKKALTTLMETQADAAAAQGAVDQQAGILQGVREQIARERFEAAIDAAEERLEAARSSYAEHHQRFAAALREMVKHWEWMTEARREEQSACEAHTAIGSDDGKPDPLMVVAMRRLPQPGTNFHPLMQVVASHENLINVLALRT